MTRYSGRCHCGSVTFEVETDLATPYRCNCSFCIRRGTIMQQLPASSFQLLSGEAALKAYGSKPYAKHYFCIHCGIQCFTRIDRENEPAVAINIGCLEGVDLQDLSPRLFDGARLL